MPQAAEPKISTATIRINMDDDPLLKADGEYTYALNVTLSHRGGYRPFLGNMEGNALRDILPNGYVAIGKCKLNDNSTCLLLCNYAGGSEIGIFKNNTYTTKVSYSGLGFSPWHSAQVKYKMNYKGERLIYWTDNYKSPMWMNLDKPNYIKVVGTDGCTLEDSTDLDLDTMKIFKDYEVPCITVLDILQSGSLLSGGYFITGQYADAAGNPVTATFPLIGNIPIYKDALSQSFQSITGIKSLEQSGKAIKIGIRDADRSFGYMNIVVVKVTNGVRRAYKVATISTSATEYIYTGSGISEEELLLDEVIKPAIKYSTAKTIEVSNSQLLLGNLKSVREFNFQPYVSKVEVQWQIWTAWSDDKFNSFKNPAYTAYMRVFRQDEVYALGLVLDLIDGTSTIGWHIPGRRLNLRSDGQPFTQIRDQFGNAINPAEWDSSNAYSGDDVYETTNPSRYQIYNTATIEGSLSTGATMGIGLYGEMSYWESTDKYDCNRDIWGDDANQPIRHHKMPDSTLFHIHDGQTISRPYEERVKLNYLGVRLPNIAQVISSLPIDIRTKVRGWRLVVADRTYDKSVLASGIMLNARRQNWKYNGDEKDDMRLYPNYPLNDLRPDPYIDAGEGIGGTNVGVFHGAIFSIEKIHNDYRKDAFFFHTPDTHFKKQHVTAGELKINVELYGKTKSFYDFVNPYPEFKEKNDDNDRAALQGYSIATYNSYNKVPQNNTRRRLNDAFYVPFNSRVGGGDIRMPLWNVFRESSVFLNTHKDVADPTVKDTSRFIINDTDSPPAFYQKFGCDLKTVERDASIYYATMKNILPNQYGSIYNLRYNDTHNCRPGTDIPDNVIFGGDSFIGSFTFKTQHVFYQNIQQYMGYPDGMAGVNFQLSETVAHTRYYYKNRPGVTNPRNQSKMMCEDNSGTGLFGIGGDGNPTALGFLALSMYGVPNFWAESDFNIELRHPGEQAFESFYPNLNNGSFHLEDWLSIKTINNDNVFNVNEDYSAKNDIKLIDTINPLFDPKADKANHYNTRVTISQNSQPEDIEDNWTKFKPLNYYDLPKNRGELIDIRYLGNYKTLFRMTQSLFMDTLYEEMETTTGKVVMGTGKIFEKQPTEVLSVDNGYGGGNSQFAFNSTEYGSFFLSPEHGKMFNLSQGLKDINEGSDTFLSVNMPLILANQINVPFPDNGSNPEGIGYISEFDDFNKLWIVTKRDYSVINPRHIPQLHYGDDNKLYLDDRQVSLHDTTLFEDKSWTYAYSPLGKGGWIGFQSFLPHLYFSQNNNLHSIINGQDAGIWEHNIDGIYHTFYGKKYPCIIENADRADGFNSYVNPNISFISRTADNNDRSEMITFNKAEVYNLYQHSGLLNLIIQDENKLSTLYSRLNNYTTSRDVALRIREGKFNFSDFYDIFQAQMSGPHFHSHDWLNPDYQSAYPIDKVINHASLKYNARECEYSLMRERWIKYRLILDNRHDRKLLLQFVSILNRQSVS